MKIDNNNSVKSIAYIDQVIFKTNVLLHIGENIKMDKKKSYNNYKSSE